MDSKTVRKILKLDDFSPEPSVVKYRKFIVTPYIDTITGWLGEEQKHWSKQHHTAKRIYEQIRDEYGFTGSYDSVQKIRKDIQTKGAQELIWEPGVHRSTSRRPISTKTLTAYGGSISQTHSLTVMTAKARYSGARLQNVYVRALQM